MMDLRLRITVVVIAVLILIYVIRTIRHERMAISDAVFWVVGSVVLVIVAAIPEIASFGASLLGIQTPVNFLLLLAGIIVIYKVFSLSVEVSRQNEKIKRMAQRIAYLEFEQRMEARKAGEGPQAPSQEEQDA